MAQRSGKKKSPASKPAPKAAPKQAAQSDNSLTIADIKALFTMMKDNEIAELNLEQKDKKIHIVSTHAPQVIPPAPVAQMMPMMMGMPGSGGASQVPATNGAEAAAPAPEKPTAPTEPALPSNLKTIFSPMVGTFYRSPAPEAAAFVQVGDTVSDDTTLCIIEAMKLMNEIKAETKGRIHKILVENGVPVEYNQPLFLVEP
jgi:acetyl-CoA carboxylase biotin carboxyl carrier protein